MRSTRLWGCSCRGGSLRTVQCCQRREPGTCRGVEMRTQESEYHRNGYNKCHHQTPPRMIFTKMMSVNATAPAAGTSKWRQSYGVLRVKYPSCESRQPHLQWHYSERQSCDSLVWFVPIPIGQVKVMMCACYGALYRSRLALYRRCAGSSRRGCSIQWNPPRQRTHCRIEPK